MGSKQIGPSLEDLSFGGARGRRATVIGAQLCCALALAAGCHQADPPKKDATPSVHILNLFGMGPLPVCNPDPQYTVVFRLRIDNKVDEIFGNNPVPKRAGYTIYSSPAVAAAAPIDDKSGEQPENSTYIYNQGGNSISWSDNPYHTDLTNKGLKPGDYIKYVVVLPHGANMSFVTQAPDENGVVQSVNGILAQKPPPPLPQQFDCADAPVATPSGGVAAVFFVLHGNPRSSTLLHQGFNIVLNSTAHAADTIVILDPKILNNG